MSTDYEFVCETCHERIHAGQRFANGCWVSGYASNDVQGQRAVDAYLSDHAGHRILVMTADEADEWFGNDPDAGMANIRYYGHK